MSLEGEAFGVVGETLIILRRGLAPFAEWMFADWSLPDYWPDKIDLPKDGSGRPVSKEIKHDDAGLIQWDCRIIFNAINNNWKNIFRDWVGGNSLDPREHLTFVKKIVNENYAHNQSLDEFRTLVRFLEDAELFLQAVASSRVWPSTRDRTGGLRTIAALAASQEKLSAALRAAKTSAEEIQAKRLEIERPLPGGNVDRAAYTLHMARLTPHPKIDLARNDEWARFYSNETALEILRRDGTSLFGPIPIMVAFDNSSGRYRADQFKLTQVGEKFELDELVADATRKTRDGLILKHATLFPDEPRFRRNGSVLRLQKFSCKPDEIELSVQYTDYFNYISTNHAMDFELDRDKQTLREFLHPDGNLCSLEHSECANLLCVNVLICTSDSCILLQKRSGRVMTFPFMFAPSVSGTLKPDRIYSGTHLVSELIGGELHDETAVGPEELDETSVKFLGIVRDLLRGGNPDLVFYCRAKITADAFRAKWEIARDRDETQELIRLYIPPHLMEGELDADSLAQFEGWLRSEFISKYADEAAPVLLGNFALWVRSRIGTMS